MKTKLMIDRYTKWWKNLEASKQASKQASKSG